MRYKKFKNAEIEVSQLAVGTWAIGGQNYGKVDKNEAICAIRRMIENGVNLIDTAPCYGNGTSEKIVGEVLKEIPREQVLISTKFGLIPDIYTHGYKKDTSYKNAMREIQSSLMNLETDYIDFYFVHWPDVNTPIDETMAALEEMKRKGTTPLKLEKQTSTQMLPQNNCFLPLIPELLILSHIFVGNFLHQGIFSQIPPHTLYILFLSPLEFS